MDIGITKWPGFLCLTSIPLKSRVQLFFLTLDVILAVKNDNRVKFLGRLSVKQSQERELSSNITNSSS